MKKIFEIRRCIEIMVNDIKVDTTDQYRQQSGDKIITRAIKYGLQITYRSLTVTLTQAFEWV